jgi:hypothetical protein
MLTHVLGNDSWCGPSFCFASSAEMACATSSAVRGSAEGRVDVGKGSGGCALGLLGLGGGAEKSGAADGKMAGPGPGPGPGPVARGRAHPARPMPGGARWPPPKVIVL